MPITISDYLPPAGSLVRFRSAPPDAKPCDKLTRLFKVEQLPALLAQNPKSKISVSYASISGGQNDEHVKVVTAICIDLDPLEGQHASRAQIQTLQDRFPGAGVVWSNGVTLLYRIMPMTWHQALPYAYQIAREAVKITGLEYDIATHFRKSGEPGLQRNHLFR